MEVESSVINNNSDISENVSTAEGTSIINEEIGEVKSKLGNCEVCAIKEAKYTCPRCEVKTCCLRCSLLHKRELECDGARDRTKFIPINKFTNLDLSSDYRLLEEITRTIETYKKDHTRKYIRKDNPLPHFLFKLKRAAYNRNTILKFLPANFVRHKQNTTRLNYERDVVFWHIDWIFSNADDLKLTDEKVRETEKLASILQKYFMKQENEVLQEKLQYYQSLGMSNVKVYLKAEEKAGRKFFELDLSSSLKDNLRKKIIIEYPTIHVVNKEHDSCFDVVDSDDEGEDKMDVDIKSVKQTKTVKQVESGKQVIDRIIKKAENDETIYKSLKNLLFISEHSDANDSDD